MRIAMLLRNPLSHTITAFENCSPHQINADFLKTASLTFLIMTNDFLSL